MASREDERQYYEEQQWRKAADLIIRSMFALLPQTSEVYSPDKRRKWLKAMDSVLELVYSDKPSPSDAVMFQEFTVRILGQ
jgi:hypothetical protein